MNAALPAGPTPAPQPGPNRAPIPGPLTLGELLDRTFRLYRKHFSRLLLAAAIFQVPAALVSTLFTGRMMTGAISALQNIQTDPTQMPEQAAVAAAWSAASITGLSVLISVVGMVAAALAVLTLTVFAIGALHDAPPTLGQAVRQAARRFWPYVGSLLLITIVLAAVFFAVVFAGSLALAGLTLAVTGIATATVPQDNSTAGVLATVGVTILIMCIWVVGMMVAFAPAAYLYARWSVSTPGLVDQRWGPVKALGGSWQLTRGHVWRCIGYLLLLGVLGFVVTTLPTYLAQLGVQVLLPSGYYGYGMILFVALASLLNIFWQPIYAIAVTLLYFDLRVRKESYDLHLQVAQLEAALAPAAPSAAAQAPYMPAQPPPAPFEPTRPAPPASPPPTA